MMTPLTESSSSKGRHCKLENTQICNYNACALDIDNKVVVLKYDKLIINLLAKMEKFAICKNFY